MATSDDETYGVAPEEVARRVHVLASTLGVQPEHVLLAMQSSNPEMAKMAGAQFEQGGRQQAAALAQTMKGIEEQRREKLDAIRQAQAQNNFDRQLGLDKQRAHYENERIRLGDDRNTLMSERDAARAAAATAKGAKPKDVPASQALGITTAAEVAENVPKVKAKYEDWLKHPTDLAKKKQYEDSAGLLALAIARGETKTGNPRADIVNKVKEKFPSTLTAARDKLFNAGIGSNAFDTLVDEAEVRARTAIEGLGLPDEHPLAQQYQRAFHGGSGAPGAPSAPVAGAVPTNIGAAPAAALPRKTIGGKVYERRADGWHEVGP